MIIGNKSFNLFSIIDTELLNESHLLLAMNKEIMSSTWNYKVELMIFSLISVLGIPPNLILLAYYTKKSLNFKRIRLLYPSQARIANSFYTYLIEMCVFDTLLIIYLIANQIFKVLWHIGESPYESIYDVSNFTCKFFIYMVRISSAMSNYLVVFLSFNRCMLLLVKCKSNRVEGHRICFNTKYLTLFLFCVCTIANVFRLELLTLNSEKILSLPDISSESYKTIGSFINLIKAEDANSKVSFQCGPNLMSITFKTSESNNSLFWQILVYNIIFTFIPIVANFVLSIYLVKKRAELKAKLIELIKLLKKIKCQNHNCTRNSNLNYFKFLMDFVSKVFYFKVDFSLQENMKPQVKLIDLTRNQDFQMFYELLRDNAQEEHVITQNNIEKICLAVDSGKLTLFKLNEFHLEFLKTCTPCIGFSTAHVLLFLPYSIIDLTNQIWPTIYLMNGLQYMTYIRYLFYGSKFYILFILSFKFRKVCCNFFNKCY